MPVWTVSEPVGWRISPIDFQCDVGRGIRQGQQTFGDVGFTPLLFHECSRPSSLSRADDTDGRADSFQFLPLIRMLQDEILEELTGVRLAPATQ